jgi:carbamate kinase
MKKKIVLALGGNALGDNLAEQMQAVQSTSRAIVDLIEQGHEVVVTHGNGPQVGMINQAFEIASRASRESPQLPMSVSVALSQGYIGYDLQNALREALLDRGIHKPVATLVTQVVVDGADPAFLDPSKPIGRFYSQEEAEALMLKGERLKEDAGRGYRRVVASPRPVDIIEKETVSAMLAAGQVVITAGGGGIPVLREGHHLRGASAVIDKDWASAKLAEMIDADMLIILTAVEKVAINFGKPDEKWLDQLSTADARRYIAEGQFAKGSMLPKVEAALSFAESKPGRQALITLLEKAREGIEGKTGTRIGIVV